MKFNKWTVGLAAVGLVSLSSAVKAEDTASTVLTSLSSTTLSGYVDTSAQWNFGTGNANNPPYAFGGAGKADGFNLNVVQLSLDKPLDETPWAAGYHVDLWMGPDANALGSQSSGTAADFAIRQAYVTMRTPVGNGLDCKLGVFDTVIGYESLASPNNPNYTRSYGFTIEPTTHTGFLGTYKVNDMVSLTAGLANTVGPAINGRAFLGGGTTVPVGGQGPKAESYKTYMGSVSLTAPSDWGWVSGATLSAGVVNGFNASAAGTGIMADSANWYAGLTLPTPVTNLKVGAAYDYLGVSGQPLTGGIDGYVETVGLYASYQATEKLGLNVRGERLWFNAAGVSNVAWEGTATAQYDLWKNVLSRVEFRWDHVEHGQFFGGTVASSPTRDNAFMLAANVIYKF